MRENLVRNRGKMIGLEGVPRGGFSVHEHQLGTGGAVKHQLGEGPGQHGEVARSK